MRNIINWLPEIYLAGWITILLLYAIIFSKLNKGRYAQHFQLTNIAIGILGYTIIILSVLANNIDTKIQTSIWTIDPTSVLIKILVLLASMIILFMSKDRYLKEKSIIVEYPILILIAALGMMLLISSNDLIALYLSIEMISLTSYILASINIKSEKSTEAGFKYFILGSLNSGILLLGMAIIYALTGETNLTYIGYYITYAVQDQLALEVGAGLIIISFLFKIAAAPFHSWAPDVYEGVNTIITAFFTIVPKIAFVYTLISLLFGPFLGLYSDLNIILQISIILSIFIGCVAGLNQTKFKRLFAYSAISHVGLILLGILPGTIYSIQTSLLYIIIYMIMSINIFSIILTLFTNSTIFISQLAGLSRAHPILCLTLTLVLFSLAGLPPLAGFFTKYLVLLSAVQNQYLILALFAILGSVISAFYYLRMVKWVYFNDSPEYFFKALAEPNTINISFTSSLIIAATFFFILTFLFYPNFLISLLFHSLISSFC